MRKELIISSIAIAALIVLSGSLQSRSNDLYGKSKKLKQDKIKGSVPDYRVAYEWSAHKIQE